MSRITFIIPSLGFGGAQNMLAKVLSRLAPEFVPEVISLSGQPQDAERLQYSGAPLRYLRMSRNLPDPRKLITLANWIRSSKPDLVHTWMYHADLLGGLAARFAGIPVLWNIRHGGPGPQDKRLTRWTIHLCAQLSRRVPRRIVCCAEAAMKSHVALGYDGSRMCVIPNGFEIERFRPDPNMRQQIRRELNIPDDVVVVGLVGRYHPIKDHANFMQAAAMLLRNGRKAVFLLAGEGVDRDNPIIVEQIAGMDHRSFFLLGRRDDIPRLTAAFDIAVSASRGEAFSNTIGEAMACAIPCTVTDVGDSAMVVGDTGRVVPPGEPAQLAAALEGLITLGPEGRKALGLRARQRIIDNFTLEQVVSRYEQLYAHVLAQN
ncbi:MAG: glycosyltransferase [Desulfuromonadales bacterium]